MSEKGLFLWIAVGLAIVVALVLIIVGGDEPAVEEVVRSESGPTGQEALVENEPVATEDQNDGEEEPSQSGEVPTVSSPAEGLPANWHRLTDREKTALNPFDCPTDENGVVHLSSETGECLQAKSDEEPPEEETSEPPLAKDEPSFNFGEPFVYDKNSEIRVNNLNCQTLNSLKLYSGQVNLTLDQFLEKHGEKYEEYKMNPSAFFFDRGDTPIWHFTYFEYLHNLEKYLATEGSLRNSDLRTQLANYSECKLEMTLKNIGPATYFPDGCRDWSSNKSFSLVGEKQTYGRKNRDRLGIGYACTMAIVPFPNGAEDVDVVSFVVEADDKIIEIRIQSPEETFRIRRD